MKSKNHICDFKYAEKLEKLRVKQDSLWYWKIDTDKPYLVSKHSRYFYSKGKIIGSAFTYSELGKILGILGDKLKDVDGRAKLLIWLIENKHITLDSGEV